MQGAENEHHRNCPKSYFFRTLLGWSAGLKSMFVDTQAYDSCVKRLARNSQLVGRAGWAGDSALTVRQRRFDHFLLTLDERGNKGTAGLATGDGSRFNHVSSIENVSPSQRITARSMTF